MGRPSNQLRDDWNAREQRLTNNHPVLRNLQNDDYPQAISILVTQARRREALAADAAADKGSRHQLQAKGHPEARGDGEQYRGSESNE